MTRASALLTFAFPLLVAAPAAAVVNTIHVTSTVDLVADDGNCTLREAMLAVYWQSPYDACEYPISGNDVVEIPAGEYLLSGAPGEDEAASGDLDISTPITIQGAGRGVTIISGNFVDRVFEVRHTAHIYDLTIKNGAPPDAAAETPGAPGGCVYAASAATFVRVDFEGCAAGRGGDSAATSAGFGGYGGAIYTTAELNLHDVMIAGARAGAGGDVGLSGNGWGGNGGAVFLSGAAATISRTTFRDNSAGAAGRVDGAISGDFTAANGGAIFCGDGGSLTIVDSVFDGNTGGPQSDTTLGWGGGVATSCNTSIKSSTFIGNAGFIGGALYMFGGTATIVNSTFTGNGDSGNSLGAAIAGYVASVVVELDHTTVTGNAGQAVAMFNGAQFYMRSSILAANELDGMTEMVRTRGHNVFGTALVEGYEGTLASPTDIVTDDPGLAALADNGGPVRTHAVEAGGAADGNGSCVGQTGIPLLTDARGVPRPSTRCDVGAFELGGDGTTMIRTSDGAEGCPAAGLLVQSGVDDDGDGVLEDGEVDANEYVCDGVDGAPGDAGPAGPAGPSGPAGTNGTNGANGGDGTDGTNGADGDDGADGEDGAAGSCTVVDHDDGTATVTCDDGSEAELGASGGGGGCSASAFPRSSGGAVVVASALITALLLRRRRRA